MNADTFENFRDDPAVRNAFAKLDRDQFQILGATCAASLATEYSFLSYTRALQILKARMSRLPPEVEGWYGERAEGRLIAYTSLVSAAEQMSQDLTSSGVDQILATRVREYFSVLQAAPYDTQIPRRFLELGATDDHIGHYRAWLRANDWNPLSFPGTGGTFAGVTKVAKGQIPLLQNTVNVIKQTGVPAIEGNDGDLTSVSIGAVIVIGAITLCIYTWPLCALAAALGSGPPPV
jgi:hypothetical protein